jgi:hypothetical protein
VGTLLIVSVSFGVLSRRTDTSLDPPAGAQRPLSPTGLMFKNKTYI